MGPPRRCAARRRRGRPSRRTVPTCCAICVPAVSARSGSRPTRFSCRPLAASATLSSTAAAPLAALAIAQAQKPTHTRSSLSCCRTARWERRRGQPRARDGARPGRYLPPALPARTGGLHHARHDRRRGEAGREAGRGRLRRRDRRRRGQACAAGHRRLPEGPRPLPRPRGARAVRRPHARRPRSREDSAGKSPGRRVRRAFHRHQRQRVHVEVLWRGRAQGQEALRNRAQACALHPVHRRAGRHLQAHLVGAGRPSRKATASSTNCWSKWTGSRPTRA